MRRRRHTVTAMFCALLLAALPFEATAESVTVAVASNFLATARALEPEFESATGHELQLVPGSSGRLYAQILNGAPFDVFLSADLERPRRLEAAGLVSAGGRFTYAFGELVLWSRDAAVDDCRAALHAADGGRIAIAKPELAPYGAAAREFLLSEGLWDSAASRLVYGENVMQALQFAATGNARLALIARSQLTMANVPQASCVYVVPAETYTPVEQQGVLLARASQREAARAFVVWLGGEAASSRIRAAGYRLPEGRN